MPAKKQITKDAILDAAMDIFRECGMDAINARELARRLSCSTQPIYLSFSGMDELKHALSGQIFSYYEAYLARETERGEYPPYKAHGMAYIDFARHEPEMFRFLFMRARTDEQQRNERPQSYTSVIESVAAKNGWSYEKAELFHVEMWFFVHGIATMLATSYLEPDRNTVSDVMTDVFVGLQKRYAEKEDNQ